MTARRAVGISALVLAALVVMAALAVDAVARSALEEALAGAFGTGASVESVDVRLFSGEVTAEGNVVSNPGGFGSPHFAALARARVSAGLTDLLGDTVTVRRVDLEGLELYLERRGAETNFGPILRSLQARREAGASGGKLYRIEELVLTGTVARVRMGAGGEGETVEVPEIRLTDLGSDGALPLGQVAGAVIRAALRAALERSGGLPGAVGGLLRGELGGLGDLPGRLELPATDDGGGGDERVRDALEEILPGGGG